MKSAEKLAVDSPVASLGVIRKCQQEIKINLHSEKLNFLDFEFLLYFWHEHLLMICMPREPQKLKNLKNLKNISKFKVGPFIFGQC